MVHQFVFFFSFINQQHIFFKKVKIQWLIIFKGIVSQMVTNYVLFHDFLFIYIMLYSANRTYRLIIWLDR